MTTTTGSSSGPIGTPAPHGSFDARWLPGSPHREAILKALADGLAHVEECGHGQPPLLVFQDGGAIPLPLVRYAQTERGLQLVADRVPDLPDQSRHRDVCGSIDELKARIRNDPVAATTARAELCRLMLDVRHMLGRLQARREAYEAFAAELRAVCDSMDAIARPPPDAGTADLAALIEHLSSATPEMLGSRHDELFALAEAVRDVANRQEHCIGRYRDLACTVSRLYQKIRGRRQWDDRPLPVAAASA